MWAKNKQPGLYKAGFSQLPKVPSAYVYDNWCVGASFPETPDFPAGTCFIVSDPANGLNNYTGGFIHSDAFDQEIKKVTTIPDLQFDPIIITSRGTKDGSGTLTRCVIAIE